MKRIAVFFDTNVIESRFSHEKHEFLFHEEIKPNSLFYKITNPKSNLYIILCFLL